MAEATHTFHCLTAWESVFSAAISLISVFSQIKQESISIAAIPYFLLQYNMPAAAPIPCPQIPIYDTFPVLFRYLTANLTSSDS